MRRIKQDPVEEISFLLPVREFPDKGTKWLLAFEKNVEGLLQLVASELVDRLDFSRLQQVNQTFIPDNLREQESDIVYLVPFRSEEVGEVLICRGVETRCRKDFAVARGGIASVDTRHILPFAIALPQTAPN